MQLNLKIKARKIAKQTWAGPGKFGVFIVLCIIIIATFESLGLSNRERNLEIRTVPLVAVQLNLKSIEEASTEGEPNSLNSLQEENSDKDRADQLILGALGQYAYENSTEDDSYQEETHTHLHSQGIYTEDDRDLEFFDV